MNLSNTAIVIETTALNVKQFKYKSSLKKSDPSNLEIKLTVNFIVFFGFHFNIYSFVVFSFLLCLLAVVLFL